MSRFIGAICIASLASALVGCAGSGDRSCAPAIGAPTALFTLYLGKAISGRGDITESEWQSFLDDTVTANLPNGYTIQQGRGAWMNPVTHRTIKEATVILVVALPQVPASLAAINRIRNEYQVRFRQQLVGMTVQQACAAF